MNPQRRISSRRRALTLVEAMLSMIVISVMLVAALRAASVTAIAQQTAAERATGAALAGSLISEALAQAYIDPGVAVFGRESGEAATLRSNWNDIDDYNGLSESPPRDRDGNVLPNLTGWQQSATVSWVSATDPTTASATDLGAKRITVVITHNNRVVATRVAVRTK